MIPPKPPSRDAGRASLWRYLRLFRADNLSAHPARLFGAKMAAFRTPFFRSFLINDAPLIDLVLKQRPEDFPKSRRFVEGLAPLLGRSVFLTNGAEWRRQRRIIDPAFEGGRLRQSFPAILAAAEAAVARLPPGRVEIEAEASHAAADAIFRTLFSMPIETAEARRVFAAFQAHQKSQPMINLAGLVPLPRWLPRFRSRATVATAREIRALIAAMVRRRQWEIDAGTAPADLATKIMTTPDPETRECFGPDEMADQVAIFFLAGHETSASALAWGLWLLAAFPEAQERVAAEASALGKTPAFSELSKLSFTRDVFRETMRLYPPVPMFLREAARPERFRDRAVPKGSQIVLSPWHLHRHTGRWAEPDAFDPGRWQREATRAARAEAYLPFSAGPRACPGAGFAMAEGVLMLALYARAFRFALPADAPEPMPVAHLTLRSRNGLWLEAMPRRPE